MCDCVVDAATELHMSNSKLLELEAALATQKSEVCCLCDSHSKPHTCRFSLLCEPSDLSVVRDKLELLKKSIDAGKSWVAAMSQHILVIQ